MAQNKKDGTSKANLRATVLKAGNVVASTDSPNGSHGRTRNKDESRLLAIEARKHELRTTANHKQQRAALLQASQTK